MKDNRDLYTYGERTLTWRANRQRKNAQNGIKDNKAPATDNHPHTSESDEEEALVKKTNTRSETFTKR
jgi:hypothetical protein